jgi:hypothetical protein
METTPPLIPELDAHYNSNPHIGVTQYWSNPLKNFESNNTKLNSLETRAHLNAETTLPDTPAENILISFNNENTMDTTQPQRLTRGGKPNFMSNESLLTVKDAVSMASSEDSTLKYDPSDTALLFRIQYNSNTQTAVHYFNYGVPSDEPKTRTDPNQLGFKFTMRNSSQILNTSKSLLETNLYQARIDIKSLAFRNKQYSVLGVDYWKTDYLIAQGQGYETEIFTTAIMPKYSDQAKRYLIEIKRQNRLGLEIFIKPILYYFDRKFLYVLYPWIKRKALKIQKSNKLVYRNIKDLVILVKTLHDHNLAFRTLTTDNIFIHDHKLKLLRSKNLATSQELNVVNFFPFHSKKKS